MLVGEKNGVFAVLDHFHVETKLLAHIISQN